MHQTLPQTYGIKLLVDRYIERRERNPRFSMRSYAKSLGISPGTLSKILSGKSKPGLKILSRFADRLSTNALERKEILDSFLNTQSNSNSSFNDRLVEISDDQFKAISEWYAYAILSLADFKQNSSDPRWIASQLEISSIEAREMFKRLERLGLIIRKGNGFKKLTNVITTSDIPSAAIRTYHSKNLEIALQKLEEEAVENRDFSAITLAIDSKKIKQAKKIIKDFRRQFWELLEQGNPDRVYTLSIQFFPVSQNSKRNTKEPS